MKTARPQKILIIDSDKKYLAKIALFFQEKNIPLQTASTPLMAEGLLRSNLYSIVITDFLLHHQTENMLAIVRKYQPGAFVIIITGFGTLESAVAAIREGCFDYLQKPVKVDRLIDAINRAAKKIEQNKYFWAKAIQDRLADDQIFEETPKVAQLIQSNDNSKKKLKKDYVESVDCQVKMLQVEGDYYATHSANVSRYGVEIARMMGLGDKVVENIKYAGILHDIGKIWILDEILLKPDQLTKDEFEQIKRHCEIGVKIICDDNFFKEEIPLILHHHECYDGSGYPCGLKEEDIPLGARILGIVDTFDSLTSKRCYRKKYTPSEAMEEIKKQKGSQFDPELVSCMEEYLKKPEA